VLLLAAAAAVADDTVVGVDAFGGSPTARKLLLERGFVVTDETQRQIFSFYVHASRVFVTTDALLHAYFANLEEALARIQLSQARALGKVILDMRKALERRELETEAWKRAARDADLYLQVAGSLLNNRRDASVIAELKLIHAAEGLATSPLRKIPLDYSRFRPTGVAARHPDLHRAYTWLHEVVFRLADDHETRQAVLLAGAWEGNGVVEAYRDFLGGSDDPGVWDYKQACRHGNPETGWPRIRKQLARLPAPRHPTIPTAEGVIHPETYRGMRLLPRPSLLDNEVFLALAPPGKPRPPPSGEEFMAAWGSAAASEIVRPNPDAKNAAQETLAAPAPALVQARRAVFESLLATPTNRRLPAYYRHPDWRFKDLNTCLAGWAHHRYIWDVHAKRHVFYSGLIEGPRGIIEPNEAFFGALLDLTLLTRRHLDDLKVGSGRFADLAAMLAELRLLLRLQLAEKPLTEKQQGFFKKFGPRLGNICGFRGNSWLVDNNLPDHTFALPVSRDVATGRERWVGQGRPRAIYVLVREGQQRFLMVGGVLSYRDHLAGVGRFSLKEWRARAAAETLPEPAWHARFSRAYTKEERLASLRAGRLTQAVLRDPSRAAGDILARKIARGDKFLQLGVVRSGYPGPRSEALALFARTNHPKLAEVLLPMLAKAPERPGSYVGSLHGWPEAYALAGKLREKHIDVLLGYKHHWRYLLIALIASIPGERA